MPKLLLFVEKKHPALRETMPMVENFQDKSLNEIISDMCYSINPEQLREAKGGYDSAAGMAANQWGIKKRIFIFTPDGSGADKKKEVMINPSYLPYLEHGKKEPEMV